MAVDTGKLNRVVRDKWGEEITYTPDGGAARTVTAIRGFDYFDETGGPGIQTATVAYLVVADDVPELSLGDAMTAGGLTYTVVVVKPDGYGMTEIILQRA